MENEMEDIRTEYIENLKVEGLKKDRIAECLRIKLLSMQELFRLAFKLQNSSIKKSLKLDEYILYNQVIEILDEDKGYVTVKDLKNALRTPMREVEYALLNLEKFGLVQIGMEKGSVHIYIRESRNIFLKAKKKNAEISYKRKEKRKKNKQ